MDVVYLFGAGATHACVKSVGSPYGVLMKDLNIEVAGRLTAILKTRDYAGHLGLLNLINNVVDEDTDFEHLITFLTDSRSAVHRQFAEDLRQAFESALRDRLDAIEEDLGRRPADLYTALFDLHSVARFSENLVGCLTLNYDLYLERALGEFGEMSIDFGFGEVRNMPGRSPFPLIKLHGSLDWEDVWPVQSGGVKNTLWIPPGIQKAKGSYPFNMLWGRARELLDCDILRVVGCRLSPNDWDLVSLLFNTRHVNDRREPYRVEIIDAPWEAERIRGEMPYLDVLSILEIDEIGTELIGEFSGGAPRSFSELDPNEREDLFAQIGSQNWFLLWFQKKAELVAREVGSIETKVGQAKRMLEASV